MVLCVKLLIVIVPDPAPVKVPVPPAGEEVTTYLVMADPPLLLGDVKATVAVVGPVAVAVPIVGASGTVILIGVVVLI
jgi:hypothetical protein